MISFSASRMCAVAGRGSCGAFGGGDGGGAASLVRMRLSLDRTVPTGIRSAAAICS